MHGVCVWDHLEEGIFPHDSDGHVNTMHFQNLCILYVNKPA